MNLLRETREVLTFYGLSESDVQWVGTHTAWFTWDEFIKLADIEYNNEYDEFGVMGDLIIVGDDWWLEREESEGSEWWAYRYIPKIGTRKHKVPKRLLIDNDEEE